MQSKNERQDNEKYQRNNPVEDIDLELDDDAPPQLTLTEMERKIEAKDLDASTLFLGNKAFINLKNTVYGELNRESTLELKSTYTKLIDSLQESLKCLITKEQHLELKHLLEEFSILPFKQIIVPKPAIEQVHELNDILFNLTHFFCNDAIDDTQKMRLMPPLVKGLKNIYSNQWEIIAEVLKSQNKLQESINDHLQSIIKLKTRHNSKSKPLEEGFINLAKKLGSGAEISHSLLIQNFSNVDEHIIMNTFFKLFEQYTPVSIINHAINDIYNRFDLLEKKYQQQYSELYEELDIILCTQYGITKTKCFKITPKSDKPYKVDWEQLRLELINGLIHQGILKPNLLNAFIQLQITKNAILYYSPIFPKLSYVHTPDGFIKSSEFMITLENISLLPDLMQQAVQKKVTELIVFLTMHPEISKEEQWIGEKYINEYFTSSDRLFNFLESLSTEQIKRCMLNDFFTQERTKKTLSSWKALSRLLDITTCFDEEVFTTKILNEIMTESHLEHICQTSQEDNPLRSIQDILDLLKSPLHFLEFQSKLLKPGVVSSVKRGTMLIALLGGDSINLSFYIQKASPTTLQRLFADREDTYNLFNQIKNETTLLSFLKGVDSVANEFWTAAHLRLIRQALEKMGSEKCKVILTKAPIGFRQIMRHYSQQTSPHTAPGLQNIITVNHPASQAQSSNTTGNTPSQQPKITKTTIKNKQEELKLQLVQDKKTFFRVLSGIHGGQVIVFLKEVFAKALKDDIKELAFLKPKPKAKKTTPKFIQQMCLKDTEIMTYLESKDEFYDIVFKLTVNCKGKPIENFELLDGKLFETIFLGYKYIRAMMEHLSLGEKEYFLELLLKKGLLLKAVIANKDQKPSESLKELFQQCRTPFRATIVQSVLNALDKEETKSILPDFESLTSLLQLWDNNSSNSCQYNRQQIVKSIIEKQLMDMKELQRGIETYYEKNNSKFLSQKGYRELLTYFNDCIKKETTKTEKMIISTQSIFKDSKRKEHPEEAKDAKRKKEDTKPGDKSDDSTNGFKK